MHNNKGIQPITIASYKLKMEAEGKPYLIVNPENNSDEYVNFYFIGKYEGKEVLYDAVIYTLRLHHESEMYEIAEHKAAQRFPSFRSIKYEEDENGDYKALSDQEEEIGLFMAEVIMDLEEEEAVKVSEHVELDPHVDFGIGLDAALNVERVTEDVILTFIKEYNEDTLKLDPTLYSFMTEDEELDE
jgi:hypothetical protein